MTANAADFWPPTLAALLRAVGVLLLAAGAALALAFAFAAALVIGVLVAGAAMAMRFWPRRAPQQGDGKILDATRTPSGWVVETRRRSF